MECIMYDKLQMCENLCKDFIHILLSKILAPFKFSKFGFVLCKLCDGRKITYISFQKVAIEKVASPSVTTRLIWTTLGGEVH